LAAKTGEWANLRNIISNNLNATSGYKPNGGLTPSLIQRVSGSNSAVLNKEFSKFKRSNETCSNDYLFYCKDGICGCADNNCPANVSGITTITLVAGVQATFQNKAKALRYLQTDTSSPSRENKISSNDLPNSYYICSVCLGGKRYTYSQAAFATANLIDFTDGSGNNFGKEAVKLQNTCANALASGSSDQKKQCRGEINIECEDKLDKACS